MDLILLYYAPLWYRILWIVVAIAAFIYTSRVVVRNGR